MPFIVSLIGNRCFRSPTRDPNACIVTVEGVSTMGVGAHSIAVRSRSFGRKLVAERAISTDANAVGSDTIAFHLFIISTILDSPLYILFHHFMDFRK